jgi:hypothetical protein
MANKETKCEDVERAGSVRQFLDWRARRNHIKPDATSPDNREHEYATVSFNVDDNPISEVSDSITIWKPDVAYDVDFSFSQIWLSSMFGD